MFKKNELVYAIRLFITLILFLEEDKEKKIKSNKNNIVNYLKSNDLWNNINDINDDTFINDLNKLKSTNVQINQIISLYEYLGKDIDDNYFDDVKLKIKSENKNNDYDDDNNDDNREENNNKIEVEGGGEEEEKKDEESEKSENSNDKQPNDDDDDRI